MRALFKVYPPAPHKDDPKVAYMDADGREIPMGKAIEEASKREYADLEEERRTRKHLWSLRHDCREEEDINPSEIERF